LAYLDLFGTLVLLQPHAQAAAILFNELDAG
jgi:hypothetical protein